VPARIPIDTARHVIIAVALLSALAACGNAPGPMLPSPTLSSPPKPPAATASPEPAELAALRTRPLRLPTLAAGDECPVTRAVPLVPPPPAGHALSTGGPPSALGHAPIFPDARYYGDDARLRVSPGHPHPGWYVAKAPWASRTGYVGWALIRTARLDGPGQALVELQMAEGPEISNALPVYVQADWQYWAGGTEVTNPGCYAYQVDGSNFTEVIVFRAEVAS
jgi:hypothetical protein